MEILSMSEDERRCVWVTLKDMAIVIVVGSAREWAEGKGYKLLLGGRGTQK
jgi:hypothetical protein